MNLVYTISVQVQVPALNLKILAGLFPPSIPNILNAITPPALAWFIKNAETTLQNTILIAQKLILAIPGITVRILVKIGPVTVVNIQLVAQPVPTLVPLPSVKLSLPSLSFNLNAAIKLGGLAPIIIKVPVPVPLVTPPQVSVKLPTVTASSSVSVNAGVR